MKFSSTFFALAFATALAESADSVKSKDVSKRDNVPAGSVTSCEQANNRYTGAVLTLKAHLKDAEFHWEGQMIEEKWKHLQQASATVDELYKTIRRVDYDTGSPVVPTLSQQLAMQAKLKGLSSDIEGATPGPLICWTHCSQFKDAQGAVPPIKDALDLLSKSCGGDQGAQPATGPPTPPGGESTENPGAEPTNATANSGTTGTESTPAPTAISPSTETASPTFATDSPSAETGAPTAAASGTVPATSPFVEPATPNTTPASPSATPDAVPPAAATGKDSSEPTKVATPSPTAADSGKPAEAKPTEEIARIVITMSSPNREAKSG